MSVEPSNNNQLIHFPPPVTSQKSFQCLNSTQKGDGSVYHLCSEVLQQEISIVRVGASHGFLENEPFKIEDDATFD